MCVFHFLCAPRLAGRSDRQPSLPPPSLPLSQHDVGSDDQQRTETQEPTHRHLLSRCSSRTLSLPFSLPLALPALGAVLSLTHILPRSAHTDPVSSTARRPLLPIPLYDPPSRARRMDPDPHLPRPAGFRPSGRGLAFPLLPHLHCPLLLLRHALCNVSIRCLRLASALGCDAGRYFAHSSAARFKGQRAAAGPFPGRPLQAQHAAS
jgi:hypothetical protein